MHTPDDQKIYLRSKYILTTIRVTVTVTVALDCPCDCPMECPWTVRRTVRGQAVFHIHFSGLAFKVSENPRFSRHLIFAGKTGCNGPFPWTFCGFENGLSVDCPLECPRTVRRTKQTGGAGRMPVQAVRLFFHGLSCTLSAFLDAECPRIFHGHSGGHGMRAGSQRLPPSNHFLQFTSSPSSTATSLATGFPHLTTKTSSARAASIQASGFLCNSGTVIIFMR